jgi:hypothetical protein
MRHWRFLVLVWLAVGTMCLPVLAADASCQLKPGVWKWFVNGDVTFQSNGMALQILAKPAGRADGTMARGKNPARWSCSHGLVKIVWSTGYTDKLTLSANGTRLAGRNQDNATVWGRWKREAR